MILICLLKKAEQDFYLENVLLCLELFFVGNAKWVMLMSKNKTK